MEGRLAALELAISAPPAGRGDSRSLPTTIIFAGVSRRTNPKKPAKSWRVIIMRSRGEYLGSVEAPDREKAAAVAIKQFALDDDQRRRLLIRERQ